MSINRECPANGHHVPPAIALSCDACWYRLPLDYRREFFATAALRPDDPIRQAAIADAVNWLQEDGFWRAVYSAEEAPEPEPAEEPTRAR